MILDEIHRKFKIDRFLDEKSKQITIKVTVYDRERGEGRTAIARFDKYTEAAVSLPLPL